MTGVETILARILEETDARAAAVKQEGAEKIDAVLAEGKRQAGETTTQWAARGETESNERHQRMLAMGELERRKMVLAAKRANLDALYAAVLDRLCQLQDSQWVAMVTGLVVNAAGGGETIVPAQGEQARWQQVLPAINEALQLQGKTPLALAADTHTGRGGCMLTHMQAGKPTGVETNLTFEALVDALRQESETESARALFG